MMFKQVTMVTNMMMTQTNTTDMIMSNQLLMQYDPNYSICDLP